MGRLQEKPYLLKKNQRFKEIGFDAVQFHDDDAVPNMNELSESEIIEEAKKVKALLDKYDLKLSLLLRVFGWTKNYRRRIYFKQ